ncbi:MAG TPA: chemotaxis protein CheD [Terracidiphilus sp.]|jgi:chemotaxis protein CheD
MRDLVIGVGDGGVSRDPDAVLVTYALGSCVALMLLDPVAHVAGMVHYMLPESPECEPNHNVRPYKFADTGIPLLLRVALAQGADKRRLLVFAAGGAQVMNDNSIFNIGKRNCLALRKALWKFGLIAHAEDTGGSVIRTVRFEVGSGRVWLQSPGGKQREMTPRGRGPVILKEACPWP